METSELLTASEYEQILGKLGFKAELFDFLDSYLTDIDFINEETKEHIRLTVNYTQEYEEKLHSLPPDPEYEVDLSECIVSEIFITSTEICWPEGYFDGHKFKGGVLLTDRTGYNNLDTVNLKTFNKVLWMTRHPIQAKKEIMKNYLNELDTFFEKFDCLIKELELKEDHNSILTVGCEIRSTEPFIIFKRGHEEVYLTYIIFLDKLCIEHDGNLVPVNNLSVEELKQIILDNLL